MSRLLQLSLLLAAVLAVPTHPQAVAPDTTVGQALRSLASRSGIVFVGQVIRIDRAGNFVQVDFRVDQPILGATGATYTLRQWAGLWPPGMQRFYVSQRALFFLHASGASGFSSPVDGMDGIVPIIPQGARSTPLLDVRRLNARLLRSKGSPLPAADKAALSLADAATVIANWKQPTWREPQRKPISLASPSESATKHAGAATDSYVRR